MDYNKKLSRYLARLTRANSLNAKQTENFYKNYERTFSNKLEELNDPKKAFISTKKKINKDNSDLLRRYRFHNYLTYLQLLSILIIIVTSFFKIMKVTTAPDGPNGEVLNTWYSPLFCIYSISYYFAVIIPLILVIVTCVIDLIKPCRWLSIIAALLYIVSLVGTSNIGYSYFATIPYTLLIIFNGIGLLSAIVNSVIKYRKR